MRTILAALLLASLAALPASADILYPAALVFETGYAFGPPNGFPFWAEPDYGDPLIMQGRVAAVGAPFDALLPPGGYELTWVFQGSACTAWFWGDAQPCSGGLGGFFEGGTLAIYLDTTPDADFLDPYTFRDGMQVLLATTEAIDATDDDPQEVCPMLPDNSDVTTYLTFVGGTWFPVVSPQGQGLQGMCNGELEPGVPAALQAIYIFPVDGTVDIYGPVSTRETTWGHVKALYR